MWTKELFGTDMYHLFAYFIIYSILGWLVESIYMSLCNKKLTNRGFATSPFCPIYGFGGVGCYILLSPLADHVIRLYICGAVLATLFEYLTAKLMIRLFGEVWWDYKDKPYNYKGIICLESTIAWGFYAIGIVKFLNGFIMSQVNRYSMSQGIILGRIIIMVVLIDFTYHLVQALGINIREYKERIVDRYHAFKARWY
ncbi:MAG: putative ABC transporter permease [Lachnospiraceae bacterium]